ncbi:hypothetical protein CYLTODRAFT_424246 [Cylindrobasidium torrendii FP15055 ss-10]|uniref:Uncharacterized protein n=1 Tax=Cylindrobasidium torrendii FP15055 ss-10 TaxID=1314674 RepID=A0A0D7B4Z1_9AGAR|nr:hypothetical protein CYLTODRAFT_424246 [Cylindrobasidium torrendii FP15055 ss-10]
MSDIDFSAIHNIADADERYAAVSNLVDTVELAPLPRTETRYGLGISDDASSDAANAKADGPSGSVAGAAAASFAPDVSDEDKEAVNLCMLFAQRAVLAKHPGGILTEAALNMYRGILMTLGWPMPVMSFREVSSSELRGRCDTVVLGLMAGFMNADAIKLFRLVLGGIENDQKASDIFNSNAKKDKGGSFSTGAVSMDSGLVKMDFGMYAVETSVNIDKFLWFEFRNANAKVNISYAEARLVKSVWGPLRDKVLKRLDKESGNIIDNIPLADPSK